MKFKLSVVIVLAVLSISHLSAQTTKAGNYTSFIPAGFTILDSASGDLNKDAIKDMILILKSPKEAAEEETPRPLLLLAGTGKGGYKLMARNDSVALCAGCGGIFGDPYEGITIKNGYFSIEHYGGSSGRWTRIITFKYDPATSQFKLHRDAGVYYHTSDPNKSEQVLNNKHGFGKVLFTQFSY